MSKRRSRKKCSYFCDGYCFWNGDTGEVCDTYNNAHDGYCPKEENDRELESLGECMSLEGNCSLCSQTDCRYRVKS